MKLTELLDYVLLDSGQWIVGDLSRIHFDMKKFWVVARRSLEFYDKHKPITKRERIMVGSSPYIFPEEYAPEFISKAYPSGVMSNFSILGFNRDSSDPIQVVYRYDKPNLYIANASSIEITAHYKRKTTMIYEVDGDPSSPLKDVEISDIDAGDYKYLKLVTGHFLTAIGRSRRAFTVSDFPITMDASELVSEGTQMVQETQESIVETNSWYYGIGG